MNAQKFKSLVSKYNAEFEVNKTSSMLYMTVFAPEGFMWCDGCTQIAEAEINEKGGMDSLRALCAERMVDGIEEE